MAIYEGLLQTAKKAATTSQDTATEDKKVAEELRQRATEVEELASEAARRAVDAAEFVKVVQAKLISDK